MTVPTQSRELTVTSTPQPSDAQLLLELAQLGQAMHIDRGSALLWKHRPDGLSFEQFQSSYPIDSDDAVAILNVLKWHETVGTLVKQKLLDRALVYDWLWVAGAWDLCRSIAHGQRAQVGVPQLWENFEALATGQS